MNQFWKNMGMQGNIIYLLRWGFISVLIGIVTGLAGTAFGHAVAWATGTFSAHPWLLFLLPAAGLLILWIYHVFGEDNNRGTNMVLESIYAENRMRLTMTPTVFLGSVLTHLCGGSAGREGAGLQMGGSLGTFMGKILRLDEKDMNIAVMCGMSGAFAALFGTPVAAAIFSMEVISVGVIYYAALVPCIFSAFTAAGLAQALGLPPTRFATVSVPDFDVRLAFMMVLLGLLASGVAALFCIGVGLKKRPPKQKKSRKEAAEPAAEPVPVQPAASAAPAQTAETPVIQAAAAMAEPEANPILSDSPYTPVLTLDPDPIEPEDSENKADESGDE